MKSTFCSPLLLILGLALAPDARAQFTIGAYGDLNSYSTFPTDVIENRIKSIGLNFDIRYFF